MRILGLSNGLSIVVNNREWDFVHDTPYPICRSTLDESQKLMASQLYRRGILTAKKVNDDIQYVLNSKPL